MLTKPLSYLLVMASAAPLCCGCKSIQHSPRHEDNLAETTKEVLLQEAGQDRHWVIRAGGLIMEEHGLMAHSDFHVIIEYPRGVHKPQMDPKGEIENTESLVRGFWRNGKPLSVTPHFGDKADGRDLVWWPSGNIAREALFLMGTPAGTWKFYNESGQAIGEGTYQDGKRWTGTFVGNPGPGMNFFRNQNPMIKETFDGGVLIKEEEFPVKLNEQ